MGYDDFDLLISIREKSISVCFHARFVLPKVTMGVQSSIHQRCGTVSESNSSCGTVVQNYTSFLKCSYDVLVSTTKKLGKLSEQMG